MNETHDAAVHSEAGSGEAERVDGSALAIRIVKGNPTDNEIAALVAVITAAQADSAPETDTRPPELWGAPSAMHRTFSPHSPYSYPASARFPK